MGSSNCIAWAKFSRYIMSFSVVQCDFRLCNDYFRHAKLFPRVINSIAARSQIWHRFTVDFTVLFKYLYLQGFFSLLI